ncbi:DUF397 domain-containing protein [Streptomyces sp. NPDC006798]|uniref:DUF397 domain-containing protein n=1 Tax=Streptomyces sp. NPDC006798 TaxID=3155462 RepID=UPI0033EDD97E
MEPGRGATSGAPWSSGWRKSSRSGSGQGQCVEVADLTAPSYEAVGVRDSKLPEGPLLMVAPPVFARFVAEVRGNGFTRP